MRKLAAIAAIAAAALTLTACGGTSAEVEADASRLVSEATAPTDSPAADDTQEGVAKFGQTYKWEDGLTVTVGKPAKFKPSQYAYVGEKKGTPVKMTVAVKNGTDKPLDLALFSITVQSGEAESDFIVDTEKGIEGSPSTKVLPGKTVKFAVGFNVANPKDIVAEVSPNDDFSRDEVLYSS